jgi:hypothetical protein
MVPKRQHEERAPMSVEGSLHIFRLENEKSLYTLSFHPYGSLGGACTGREVGGIAALKQYLAQLKIHADIINDAMRELAITDRAEIPNFIAPGAEFPGGDGERL